MQLSDETIDRIIDRWGFQSCPSYGEAGYGSWGAVPTTHVVLGDLWLYAQQHADERAIERARKKFPERFAEEQARFDASGRADPARPWIGPSLPLLGLEQVYPRLWAQLEAQGCEFHFDDEWLIDDETGKAWRTQPDSYTWQPATVHTDDGDLLTPDGDPDDWLDWARNNEGRCVTQTMSPGFEGWLIGSGWTRQPERDDYASGWFDGQTDTPAAVVTALTRDHGPDIEWVFVLTENSQFYQKFCAYWRSTETEEDE